MKRLFVTLFFFLFLTLTINNSASAEDGTQNIISEASIKIENIVSGIPVDINKIYSSGVSSPGNTSITDGDDLTGSPIQDSVVTLNLSKVSDIEGYRVVGSGSQNWVMNFFGPTGNLLMQFNGKQIFDNTNIKLSGVKTIQIVNTYSASSWLYELEIFGLVKPPIVYEELKDLSLQPFYNQVKMTWINPTVNPDFTGTKIYKNGVLLTTLSKTVNSYIDKEISENSSYAYKITAVYYDGHETEGISKIIETPGHPEPEEVTQVKVKPYHNRVDLSWTLPEQNEFKHVNIYRDTITRDIGMLSDFFLGSNVYAANTKIFETNGTYFNDLTVKPETEYEYTLTTQTTLGDESQGVTVRAVTPELIPEIEDGDYKEDENGDFLFTWTSPTTGKVKVLIDGKEYKIVEASLKQILIPKEDMKYDIFNNPKVTLVPISEDGKEGTPTKPGESGGIGGVGGGKIPFGPTDLLKSIIGLLGVIAPILLLSLAIIFFKPIKNVIVKAVQNNRERKMYR